MTKVKNHGRRNLNGDISQVSHSRSCVTQELCRLKPQTPVAKGSFLVFPVMTLSAQPPGWHFTELVPSNCQLVRNEEDQPSIAKPTAHDQSRHSSKLDTTIGAALFVACCYCGWQVLLAKNSHLDGREIRFSSDSNSAGTS